MNFFTFSAMRLEVRCKPSNRSCILAFRDEDDFALRKIGDNRDALVPLLAGFIYTDVGDSGIIFRLPGFFHTMSDEPPESCVMLFHHTSDDGYGQMF